MIVLRLCEQETFEKSRARYFLCVCVCVCVGVVGSGALGSLCSAQVDRVLRSQAIVPSALMTARGIHMFTEGEEREGRGGNWGGGGEQGRAVLRGRGGGSVFSHILCKTYLFWSCVRRGGAFEPTVL